MKQKEVILLAQKGIKAANQAGGTCCNPNLNGLLLPAEQAEEAARLFAALADSTRLTILNLIARSEEGEICVCDITAAFKVGQPTISHHLKILRDAGLIRGDKRGKWVYYSVVKGREEVFKHWLGEILALGLPV